MQNANSPEFIIKFSDVIHKNLLRLEIMIIVIGLLGFFLKLYNKAAGSLILTLSLSSLAVVYFLIPIKNFENKYDKFITELTYYSYSVALISILFVLQRWPLGLLMFNCGLSAMILALIFSIFLDKFLKKVSVVDKSVIIRTIISFAIVLLLQLTHEYKELKKSDAAKIENRSIK